MLCLIFLKNGWFAPRKCIYELDVSEDFFVKYKEKVKWEDIQHTNLHTYLAKYTHENVIDVTKHVTENKHLKNSVKKQIFLDNKMESFKFMKNDF